MLDGIKYPKRSSLIDDCEVHYEWTYTDGSGAVLFDSDLSDRFGGSDYIATPVADGGTGITNVVIPKSSKIRVKHLSVEPAAPATIGNVRLAVPVSLAPTAGTMVIRFYSINGTEAVADPQSGSRVRLTLSLST